MSDSLTRQLEKLQDSYALLKEQRALLGDALAPALDAVQQQITALEAQIAAQGTRTPVEERRLITILFTDIVGSTSLAEKLDPEEWRRTVARLHEMVGNSIANHQGTVAQYLGDGLLAFFGAQQSSEFDPENAIRAALDFQTAIGASFKDAPAPIQIRVGIHSGLVVVGELGAETHKEFTATGDAMNVAARLQSAAPPGGVLVSHETYRYVRGVFDVTPQPPLTVKGKTEPIRTYLVRRAKPRPFRTVVRGVAGVETRTIGRTVELEQLRNAYLDAYDHKHVVWTQLIAEPGMGKSRLLEDTREWIDLRNEIVRILRARAYAEDSKQPFALVRRMWFDRFQIAEDAPLAQAEARWVQQFNNFLGREDVEAAQALGLLVGLPFEDSPYVGAMRDDPRQVKGRAFVVSRELIDALRVQDPIEVLLEDLHLADAASIEYFIEVLWNAAVNPDLNGIFVLGTARPEWKIPPTFAGEQDATLDETTDDARRRSALVIQLAPLTDAAARELAVELLQHVNSVPEDVLAMIVERSEGVPYFAEEMVNYFIDRGIIDKSVEPWRFVMGRLRESPLPATLQHLLLTRLSVLSENERAALQRGSIFGRNFWTGGVLALGAHASDDVLTELQPRGFVVAQPDSSFDGEQEWAFYHNLLRDVTYESVLKRERAALHKKAAEWLEQQARAASRLEEFAGLLGDHYEKAAELNVAAEWFMRAGERAMEQGAPREAKHFFERALALLPPVERELRWRALLGHEGALDRLAERVAQGSDGNALVALAEELDNDGYRAEAAYRYGRSIYSLGETERTLQAATGALVLAQRAGNKALEARALSMLIIVSARSGDLEGARALLEPAIAAARASGNLPALVTTLANVSTFYGETGDTARSISISREALAAAQSEGDRFTAGTLLGNLGYDFTQLGMYKEARLTLEEALKVTEAFGDRRRHSYALQNLSWNYLRSGDGRTARQLQEQAFQGMTAAADAYGLASSIQYFGHIAEKSGDFDGAARRFAEARGAYIKLEMPGALTDSIAGLARCALAQGDLEHARHYAGEVWNHLTEGRIAGIELITLCYQTCADIFDALGESEKSQAAVQAGYDELMARAEKISDPKWRKSFLENVRENRAMVEMWERSQG